MRLSTTEQISGEWRQALGMEPLPENRGLMQARNHALRAAHCRAARARTRITSMAGCGARAALIISTYNWPEALGRVLESALRQSCRDFEIIIADDGSRPETARAAAQMLASGLPSWRHVRQEDTGFRQSRVRNMGVRHSQADYLIFIDHDVLLHPDFVRDHLEAARDRTVLIGKRCFLPPDRSAELISGGLKDRWWPVPWLPGLGNRKNALHWPTLGRWLDRPRAFQTSLRGCNLSVHRADFLRVDGFDESYDGLWGREDSDFCYRLFHAGCTARNLWFRGLQAHLYHPQRKRLGRDHLDDELDRVRAERRTHARRGFSQMDSEGAVIGASCPAATLSRLGG
jgi:glycosyltransferase involved in cell wall biosynthesis